MFNWEFMTTLLEKKKSLGGPYSKDDQEGRRDQVYVFHFENGYSALKIAEMLDVNRNTVNEDIKYWNKQITMQFGKENLAGTLCRQIERLDIQRKRLVEKLEKQDDILKTIRIEKMLFDIDYKITGIISKVLGNNLQIEEIGNEKVSEQKASELVRDICLSGSIMYPDSQNERDILRETIVTTSCDIRHARNIFKCLIEMGLEVFSKDTLGKEFDLLAFANAKGIITTKEVENIIQKREEIDRNEKQRLDNIERKYVEKHGRDRTKWTKSIFEQMDDEMFRNLN